MIDWVAGGHSIDGTRTRISVLTLADSRYQLSVERFAATIVVGADGLRYALRLAYREAAEGLLAAVGASGTMTRSVRLNRVQVMALSAFFKRCALALMMFLTDDGRDWLLDCVEELPAFLR